MWRWVIGGVVALLIAFGIAAAIISDTGIGNGRWGDERVERIVDADGTETLVVHDDRAGFPFGIIVVPLVIFGVIALARGIFGGGPRGGPGRWGGPGGPGGWSYGPPWAYGGYSAGGPDGPGGAASAAAPGQAPAAPPWFEEWHRRTHDGQTATASPATTPPVAAPPAID